MHYEFVYHPAMISGEDSPQTLTLYFLGDKLLAQPEFVQQPLQHPPWTRDSLTLPGERELLLGTVNDVALRMVEVTQQPAGWQTMSLRDCLQATTDDVFKVINAAAQLRYWLSTQNFCSRCGDKLQFTDNDRALTCPACGYRSYPKISPCVIGVVRKGRTLLLAHSSHHRTAMYSCLAGFIEAGESAEEALAREVEEEAGIQIKNAQYMVSQAWPFPHQLMLGYLCEYAGGELVIDTNELETADWFDIDQLPQLPAPQTVARKLIDAAVAMIRSDIS